MNAKGKQAESVASANEGLNDALLAALDTFEPMRCEWNNSPRIPPTPCGAVAGWLLVFGCCGTTVTLCPQHRDPADAQLVRNLLPRAGRKICRRCRSAITTWRFVKIGGAK